ncbi:hypothetical protein Tco_0521108, partial [Tanacetum coccineum]
TDISEITFHTKDEKLE